MAGCCIEVDVLGVLVKIGLKDNKQSIRTEYIQNIDLKIFESTEYLSPLSMLWNFCSVQQTPLVVFCPAFSLTIRTTASNSPAQTQHDETVNYVRMYVDVPCHQAKRMQMHFGSSACYRFLTYFSLPPRNHIQKLGYPGL